MNHEAFQPVAVGPSLLHALRHPRPGDGAVSRPTLYAVQKPSGEIVQAAPAVDFEQALWEAACRDPQVKAIYNPESRYNVATAKRKGFRFVEAEVVAKEPR